MEITPCTYRAVSHAVRVLELEHLLPGSGRLIPWEPVDVLEVAFAITAVEGDTIRRRYGDYRLVARAAARLYLEGGRPGWIVTTPQGVSSWAAEDEIELADYILRSSSARVVFLGEIVDRLEAEVLTLDAGAASSSA